MRLKNRTRRYVVPVALAATLVAALFISPAVGGPKFVTGKKVVTTINKKTTATQIRVTESRTPGGTSDANASTSLLASLTLTPGPYVVTSTFTLRKDTAALVVNCKLRLPNGKGEDSLSFFGGGGTQLQVPGALSITGNVKPQGAAELRCYDGSVAVDSAVTDIEITATKLPRVALQTIP